MVPPEVEVVVLGVLVTAKMRPSKDKRRRSTVCTETAGRAVLHREAVRAGEQAPLLIPAGRVEQTPTHRPRWTTVADRKVAT